MSSSPEWFCRRGRELRGPFTSQELRDLAATGRIKPTDRVRQGRDGAWSDAADIRGLFATVENRPLPPLPRTTVERPSAPPAAVPAPQWPTIGCPNCDRHVQLPSALTGQALACPYCGNRFSVSPHGGAMPVPTGAAAPPEVECPFCSELIKASAKKCKHCGEILDVALRTAVAGHSQVVTVNVGSNNIGLPIAAPYEERSQLLAVVLAFLFGPIGLLYSTVSGGLLMLALSVLLFLLFPPLVLLTGIACVIWAAVATSPSRYGP